jgi:hypothetical protein
MEKQREQNRESGENSARIVSVKIRSKRIKDQAEKKERRSKSSGERKVCARAIGAVIRAHACNSFL